MSDPWLAYARGEFEELPSSDTSPLPWFVSSSTGLAWLFMLSAAGFYLGLGLFAFAGLTGLFDDPSSMPARVGSVLALASALLGAPLPVLAISARRRYRKQGLGRVSYSRVVKAVFDGEAMRAASMRLGWTERLRYIPIAATAAFVVGWIAFVARFMMSG